MTVTLPDLFLSFINPHIWPTGRGLQDFLLSDLNLGGEFNSLQSSLFNFHGRNCTSVMSQANESCGFCSWWIHSCHGAGLEWKTNPQINGDIINCRNVTGLELKLSIVNFQLLNAPVGLRAMEIHQQSSVNGRGWAQTLLTDGKSCELATAPNPNAWESLRADLELWTQALSVLD